MRVKLILAFLSDNGPTALDELVGASKHKHDISVVRDKIEELRERGLVTSTYSKAKTRYEITEHGLTELESITD